MIKFDAKKHKYYDKTGKEYISVTTLLGQLFPFDRNMIARQISQNPSSAYYKWPIKKIFQDWTNSAKEGNILHNACEKYILKGIIPEDPILKHCVSQYSKLKFKGTVIPEQKVYSTKYYIAGTADILEDYGDKIWLWDIKSCKKMDSDRKHKFSLQLEIYKRLIEERLSKPCIIGGIVFFENYVKAGLETKLTIVKPENVKGEVDFILEERLKQIQEQDNESSK